MLQHKSIFAVALVLILVTHLGCSSQQDDEATLKKLWTQVEDIGPENIIIRSVKPDGDLDSEAEFGLTLNDHRRLLDTIPTIEASSIVCETDAVVANPRNETEIEYRIVGCTPTNFDFDQLAIERGHIITQLETNRRTSVCVLSHEIAERFFPVEDPIGKIIFLPKHDLRLKIVGVLKQRTSREAFLDELPGRDFSREIYVPITWMIAEMVKKDGESPAAPFAISQITVMVNDFEKINETADAIRSVLQLDDAERNDFKIVVPFTVLKETQKKLGR